MTIAAIYAAGVGGAAASSNADTHNMRSIEITDAILKYNEDLRAGKQRNGIQSSESLQQRGSNGKNVHRAIATQQNSKVPFKFEAGQIGRAHV